MQGQDGSGSWEGILGFGERQGLWGAEAGSGEAGGASRVGAHLAGICWVHTCARALSEARGHYGDHTQARALPSR